MVNFHLFIACIMPSYTDKNGERTVTIDSVSDVNSPYKFIYLATETLSESLEFIGAI